MGESFKSLNEGKVTVSVTENGSASVEAPNPPGIFRPEIKPVKAGSYFKVTFDVVTKDFADQIVIDDITVYPNLQTAIESQVEEPEGNEIPYLKEQAWKVDFANQEVKKQMYFYTIRTTGQVLIPPSDEAVISAKSSGIVNFNGNSYISGMNVFKGEGLFSVSGSNLNEQNINTKILEARYDLEKAESEYNRAVELVKDKIISEKEFLAIENTYDISRTLYRSLTQNYSGSGVRVFSPISGFIRTINVQQGQFVEA
ncbi:MAG TPA: efflux RND transporter periplasmic adaptor subunit, partial [Ignavibacteria bacterium]|nr:efflux RND transporter periplasmic adaptor subunit [Ignavibacteria bacterium]